jgi:long-chain acyl-CoA synthetase
MRRLLPWSRSVKADGPALPKHLPTSILRPILRNLLRRPWRVVAIDDWRRWRAIQLYTGAVVLAREIERQDSSPHVGIMLPTSGLFPMALLATWFTGRTAVPVNYLLAAVERDYVLEDAEVDLVITVEPMLEQFGALPANVRTILLDRLQFPHLPRFRRPPREDPEAMAVLIYTSGTSGKPKGVMLTVRNLAVNTWQCMRWGEVTTRDVFLGVLPQFHSFGLTVLTLVPLRAGAKVVYTARFVPRKLLQLAREYRPTAFIAIPAMYNGLLADRTGAPADFTSFRLLICGAEPLPSAVRERFEERFGVAINEGYGLTETSPALNWVRPGEVAIGSVGKPLPLVQERIVDRVGHPLPQGEEGEICVRGPMVMKGYYKRPESTAAVFDSEGWFHTGDLGSFDAEGRLSITGRLSDLMIIAGENVFPREIEDVLNHHASVADCAVVGVMDRSRGEVPVAFVELAEGAAFDEARLRAFCREQLATFKVPRRIIVVEALPRSPTGKVLKRLLPLDGLDPAAGVGAGE